MSELVLTLRQPAQIGDRSREDFVLSTQEYIPGTVVRGAFAASWLAANGVSIAGSPERLEFLSLFEGGVRFGALLRPCTEFAALSLISHKYEANDDCAVVEYDQALDDNVPIRCADCGSPLEQVKGLRGERAPVRRRTSVAIGGAGVARRGQLFTRETLGEGQVFRGTLIARDAGLVGILAGLAPVRVGGRRTTHGLADVSVHDGPPPPTAERREDGLLILRLRSPGIFVDRHGRPSRDPDVDELAEVLGTPVRIVRRWTRWQQIGGWHIASGIPKPAELAVTAGSTFLIDPRRPVDDAALDELGRRGVGLRRHEGFGDLAPPPVLREGRLARETRAREQRRLLDSIAPLRRVQVRWPDRWSSLLGALGAHARGDAAATERLRRESRDLLDADVSAAVATFLGLGPADAAYVARELGEQ